MAPELTRHVSEALKSDSKVMKEARIMREEQGHHRAKKKGGGKGDNEEG